MNGLPEALKTFRQDFDIRVFVDRNKGDWHMPMEWHTSLEIFMCTAGSGRYQIGEKWYEFETGDIFVINNGELHKSEIYENGAFDAFIVMFSPEKMFPQNTMIDGRDILDVFYNRTAAFSHMYRPTPQMQEVYGRISDLMLQEFEEKKEGYK